MSLFAVRGDAVGLTRTPLPTMDQTRKQARLEFAGTPAPAHRRRRRCGAGLSKTLDLAAVALAAEQVGGAQHVLDMRRSSTPRPASSSAGRSAASRPSSTSAPTCCSRSSRPSRPPTTPAWAAAEDSDELPVVASLAKSYCSEAYFHAAAENIQIHGGIGFTWEHPAHLYFKRAKSSELLLGDPVVPPRAAGPAHRDLRCRAIQAAARSGSPIYSYLSEFTLTSGRSRCRAAPRIRPG